MILRWSSHTLKLRRPFAIATGTSTTRPTLIVELEDSEGRIGRGEATPIRYLAATLDSVTEEVRALRDLLADVEFPDGDGLDALAPLIDSLHEACPNARSGLTAVDLALHDLLGKRCGSSLSSLLGSEGMSAPPSAWTVGIGPVEERLEVAREGLFAGMVVLKLKVGSLPIAEDAAAVQALREIHTGDLLIDANGGFSEEESIEAAEAFAEYEPCFLEQPIPRGDPAALGRIRERSPLPIVADEDALDLSDLPGLRGQVDGINIKLAKCGGLLAARRMIDFARNEGWRLMLGCMVESSVALTAAGFLAPFVDHTDLDAALLIANDPFRGVRIAGAKIEVPKGPGLGLQPS